MINTKIAVGAIVAATAVAGLVLTRPDGEPKDWLEDFEYLKQELASGYANLEWTADHNNLDLAGLAQSTEDKLSRTSSRRRARKIIADFLESFNDPHLRAEATSPPEPVPQGGSTWAGPSADASAKEALEAFGYRSGSYDWGLKLSVVEGFQEVSPDNSPFPTGLLTLPDGRKLGVLRIKYFGDERYWDSAAEVWPSFQALIQEETCNSACWWQFALIAREELMRELAGNVELLRAAGADAIALDVTGNGGGSEWAEDVARLFSGRHLVSPPASFVRHPHWERPIASEIESLQQDLNGEALSSELAAVLEAELAAHQSLLEQITTSCDASVLWQESTVRLPCERLASDPHGRHRESDFPQDQVDRLAARGILFSSVRHPDFVGRYDGPLFVILDGGSASATEQFATLLQRNGAATIVGEKSYGAGCGYTNGGIKVYLHNTGLRVWMSDCLRLRADGENELAGVEPDLAGWASGESGKDRVRQMVEAMGQLETW